MSCVNCDCQVISTVVRSHVNGNVVNVEFCQLSVSSDVVSTVMSCHVSCDVELCQL